MTDINPVTIAPIGTPIFYVPIRYWETQEPETGHITKVEDDPNFIYAHHDDYGHNVYLNSARAFLSRDEAIEEAKRLVAEDAAKEKIEIDALMEKIFKDYR